MRAASGDCPRRNASSAKSDDRVHGHPCSLSVPAAHPETACGGGKFQPSTGLGWGLHARGWPAVVCRPLRYSVAGAPRRPPHLFAIQRLDVESLALAHEATPPLCVLVADKGIEVRTKAASVAAAWLRMVGDVALGERLGSAALGALQQAHREDATTEDVRRAIVLGARDL